MPPFSDHKIICGDCVEVMSQWPEGCIDLVFADPPFNIGYKYKGYDDNLRYEDYVAWSRRWMGECVRVLKPDGTFYVAIGDAYAAEIRVIGRQLGLTLRNWIIWQYSFGQNMRGRFSLSHTHIFYFSRDRAKFTFNDMQVRYPSSRHTEYGDRRANPLGRLPDDVWDEFPRVCGTFKERQGWHGCQMPESLLARIIRVSSNPGEVVLDPFAGSGTTPAAAVKLGRIAVGIDMGKEFAAESQRRLERAIADRNGELKDEFAWYAQDRENLKQLYRETTTPCANLVANETGMACFARCLNERCGRDYSVEVIKAELTRLDSVCELPRFKNDRPFVAKRHRLTEHARDRRLKQSWYTGLGERLRAQNEVATEGLMDGNISAPARESADEKAGHAPDRAKRAAGKRRGRVPKKMAV